MPLKKRNRNEFRKTKNKRIIKKKRMKKKDSKTNPYAPLLTGLAGSSFFDENQFAMRRKRLSNGGVFDNDKKPKVDDYELIEKKNKGRELTYRGYTITQTDKECILEIAYDTLDATVIAIDDLIKSGKIE